MKMIVCKSFRFDAAHFLPNYEGKCSRLHGHTWILEVELLGSVNSRTGFVVDFVRLKNAVNREVLERLDHSLLNDTVGNPTCENLLCWVQKALEPWVIHETKCALTRLRLWETPDSFTELKL